MALRNVSTPPRLGAMALFGTNPSRDRASRASDLAPATRELRAQAVHRLQVGLFGLAAMLLLVSLASVIMQRVHTADRNAIASTIAPSATPASDPLVDLGVAPQVPVAAASPSPAPQRKPLRTDTAH